MKKIVLLLIIGIVILLVFYLLIFCYIPREIIKDGQLKGYYVANDGDDSNNGIFPETPWRTIGKVNSEIGNFNPGDDVYFKRGDTFTDSQLNIKTGGNSLDSMIIGAYGNGSKPIFSNNIGGIVCDSTSIGDIEIQNLEIKDVSLNGIRIRQRNLSNITICNVDVDNCSNNGIILDQIDGYKIENCTVSNCGNSGIVILGSSTFPITNGIILNCTMHNIAINDGISLHMDSSNNDIGPNHLIVNCRGWYCNEQAFDITSGENIYIKNCEGYDNGNAPFVLGHDVQNVTVDNFYSHDENYMGSLATNARNVIVRNSIFTFSDYYILNIYGQDFGDLTENLTIYNNDFIWDGGTNDVALQFYILNLKFKNNIFYSIGNTYPDRFLKIGQGGNTSNRNMNWSYNIWWRGDGGTGDDTWWYIDNPSSELDLTEWNALDEVHNDIRTDPKMVDPVNDSFGLQSDSPAIDNGGFLTTTIGSGSGTQITVEDAGYFCDGFGLTDGDVIKIGSNQLVMITDVDYSSNIIIVDQSITWDEGDPVSMPYSGSAPDIGAYEFVSATPG